MDFADMTPEQYSADFDRRVAAARAADENASWMEKTGHFLQKTDEAGRTFYDNLPRNVTVGVLNAGIAMAKSVNWVDHLMGAPIEQATQAAQAAVAPGTQPYTKSAPVPDEAIGAVEKFRDWAASQGDQQPLADGLVQTGVQFALPFSFYSKAFGVARGAGFLANIGRVTAAEAATGATAMEPDGGRMADLVKMGRDSETRFGDMLRAAAPDDSLVNHYLNWMTADRANESEAEARFKNAVDNVVGAGAANGLLKTAAGTFKASRGLLSAAASELGGGGPVGRAAQRGSMGVPQGPLYRGVAPGVNPEVPRNRAGALFYTPKSSEAVDYGALVHKTEMPKNVFDAGSLPDFLKSQSVDPSRAGHQDALMEALSKYSASPGASEWLRFTYPLPGSPEEYVRFPAAAKGK